MPRTIQLAASLPAPPDRLFDMYLDPVEHAAFTGSPVTISAHPGALFRAFNNVLTGTILQVVPKRLIVQSWRSPHWGPADLDSTLILTFLAEKDGGRIEVVHVNVVDEDFAGVSPMAGRSSTGHRGVRTSPDDDSTGSSGEGAA